MSLNKYKMINLLHYSKQQRNTITQYKLIVVFNNIIKGN